MSNIAHVLSGLMPSAPLCYNNPMPPNQIRIIALCVFRHEGNILVCEHLDGDAPYYRPIGGRVEYGEKTEATIRREVKGEIAQEITNLKLLSVLENVFYVNGATGHEIVYIYDAQFADASVYEQESITVHETSGVTLKAAWRSIAFFNDTLRLVPGGLLPLLNDGR
jgi:ADP-ribose pyrophosphatase YjhB (NUDIX family)